MDGNLSLETIYQEAASIPSIRCLYIQREGNPLRNDCFRDVNPNRAYNIKSASKSVIALLVGIAIDKGYIDSINDSLISYIPSYFEMIDDEEKRSITIKQLVTMTAPLETTSFYNYGKWVISENWIEFILNQEKLDLDDGEMVYSTGSTHLLSVLITESSGMSTREFANTYLFKPLGILVGGWDKDPQGYYMGGNNLALKPADMMKIGQLVLDNGFYKGEQIISKEWIRDSFKSYTVSNFNPYNYGYGWWNQRLSTQQVFFAWGFGGQYIFIIPDIDAVVVLTSSLSNADQRRTYKEPIFTLLSNSIIPYLEIGKY